MATIHGNSGVIKAGATPAVIAKVQDFTLTEEAPSSPNTGMGEAWENVQAGAPKRWSGTINCLRVDDDAGQNELVVGATVPVELYGDGEGVGSEYRAGNVYIERITRTQNRTDNASLAFEFTGAGALVSDTVT